MAPRVNLILTGILLLAAVLLFAGLGVNRLDPGGGQFLFYAGSILIFLWFLAAILRRILKF